MKSWKELAKEHNEERAWIAQYLVWVNQFIPKDAKFIFDPKISEADAFRKAEEGFLSETL